MTKDGLTAQTCALNMRSIKNAITHSSKTTHLGWSPRNKGYYKGMLLLKKSRIRSHLTKIFACFCTVLVTQSHSAEKWSFNEEKGTTIGHAQNSGGKSKWEGEFSGAATDGAGVLVINGNYRGSGVGTQTVKADLAPVDRGTVQAKVVINSYTWGGSEKALQTVFLGFNDPSGSRGVRLRLQRLSANEVALEGQAFGRGASNIDPEVVGKDTSNEPLTLAIEVDIDSHNYTISYRVGDEQSKAIGVADLAQDWRPGQVFFSVSGNMFGENFTHIDEISVSTNGNRKN